MATPDNNSERQSTSLNRRAELIGQIVMVLNDRSDEWLSALNEELLHPSLSRPHHHLRLVTHEDSPVELGAVGMTTVTHGKGTLDGHIGSRL